MEVRFESIERQFLTHAQFESEAAVMLGRVGSQQGGANRRDGDRHVPGRHPPQPDGARAGDFGMRRELLARENVKGGKKLRTGPGVRDQQVEEGFYQFGKQLRPLVAVGDDQERAFGRLP